MMTDILEILYIVLVVASCVMLALPYNKETGD